MKKLRHATCILLAAAWFVAAPAAYSTPFVVDQSDIWYTVGESGWAIQIIQRASVIFATIYIYGPSGAPTWYVATLQYAGNFVWTGDLYATTGPYFGTVPFDPANVVATNVGTMTWTAQTVETAVLNYNVGAINVVKSVTRYTSVFEDFSGHYGGGLHSFVYGCTDPAFNGTVENVGVLDITQSGQSVTLRSFPTTGDSCTYDGTQTQSGQMGIIDGSYTCTDGTMGAFHLFGIQVNITGITGRFFARNFVPQGCQQEGWFGGLRVTTF